jgi:hypothetical protein
VVLADPDDVMATIVPARARSNAAAQAVSCAVATTARSPTRTP